jgi:hypothetical protein
MSKNPSQRKRAWIEVGYRHNLKESAADQRKGEKTLRIGIPGERSL